MTFMSFLVSLGYKMLSLDKLDYAKQESPIPTFPGAQWCTHRRCDMSVQIIVVDQGMNLNPGHQHPTCLWGSRTVTNYYNCLIFTVKPVYFDITEMNSLDIVFM